MSSTAGPIALNISLTEVAKVALPASLEARLSASPKSPEELSEAIKNHGERASALRNVFLEAVRDRAARESQRAVDAKMRKLRLAANRVDKVQRKLDATMSKVAAKKEATETEREARKARREEAALAVAEARSMAANLKAARIAELAEAEKQAHTNYSKKVQSVVAKNASAVKHAVAVVANRKEKEKMALEEAAEKLEARLERAALTRPTRLSKAVAPASPDKLHLVRNEAKVHAEMRMRLLEASMAKAAEKRAAVIEATALKASNENAKAASVVAAQLAKSTGSDTHAIEAKAQMYERLLNAEVARLTVLKGKCVTRDRGDTVSLIVVRVDKPHVRMPPPALSLRLSVKGGNLLATAGGRQAGAKARRGAMLAEKLLKASKENMRRAAALGRVRKAAASLAAAVQARTIAHSIAHAIAQGKRAATCAMDKQRSIAAAEKRKAAHTYRTTKRDAAVAKSDAAKDRRDSTLRGVSKRGVAAVRAAAAKSRRDAKATTTLTASEAHKARCAATAGRHDALIAKRIEVARKRMTAPHPKTEGGGESATAEPEKWSEA